MHFGICEAVSHWGQFRPHEIAVRYNGNVLTFKELDSTVDGLAHRIDRLKLKSDRVAIAVNSKYRFLISLLSILRAGKSVILLNTGLPLEAIETNIRDTETQAIIYDDHYKHLLGLIDVKYSKNMINIKKQLDEIQYEVNVPSFYIPRSPSDEWGVLFSSGTTGIPKGIVRDHYSIVIEMLGWCIELQINRGMSFYIGRPIFYTGGLVLALSTLLVGGCIIINDYIYDNDNKIIWENYQRELALSFIDLAFFVPDQIRWFTKLCETESPKTLGAKAILIMGAPITGEEKLKASKQLNSMIIESWGNSESLGTITEPEDIYKRPNSIGRPFLSDELFIVDDKGKPLPPGQYGRLAGGEEASFDHYCNRPSETDYVKQNKLIISDDIGYMDEDGYFYVRGRVQDCILIKNETVFLPELEAKLKTLDIVEDCMVVANRINENDVELVGAIVPSKNWRKDERQLLTSLNQRLKISQKLQRILIFETLPHLPSGKLDKVQINQIMCKI